MPTIKVLPAVLLTCLVASCAGSHVQVKVNYDDTSDFAGYRTFAVMPAPKAVEDMPGYSELTGRQIRERIASNLVAKGLSNASQDAADLLVSFTLGGQERTQLESDGIGLGWAGGGDVWTENYVHGSLVIAMSDRTKQQLVWHGWGSENIFDGAASEEIVLKAVDAVLAKYPPQPQ